MLQTYSSSFETTNRKSPTERKLELRERERIQSVQVCSRRLEYEEIASCAASEKYLEADISKEPSYAASCAMLLCGVGWRTQKVI